MLKKLLKLIYHYKQAFNPFIRYNASAIGEISGINELKREIPIIVSLYSTEEHFDELELTLYSLCSQNICPDRIILWLSDEYELSELPYTITKYIKNGLEIKFVEDKGDFTPLIYTLKDFEKSIIVIVKDDIYYPKNWLKKLYHSYISNPEDIHANNVLKVKTNRKNLSPYKEWEFFDDTENASFYYFPLISGGILYPPDCFSWEIIREDIYKKKVNTTPEIWCWIISLVSGRKTRIVKNHMKHISCINYFRTIKTEYNYLKQSKNTDAQISKLMEFYRQNISQKLGL